MKRSWLAFAAVATVVFCCPLPQAFSAERKEWVQLSACKYLDHDHNDGDSFYVRCGTEELIVRLYFVDAPETNLRYPDRVREQSEYFGITLDETLRAGKQATLKVRDALEKPFTVWTRWASAAGRTKVPRFYGFVQVEGQDIAQLLLSSGLARVKGVTVQSPEGVPSRDTLPKLRALEQEAQQQRQGAWATSTLGTTRDDR